MQGFVNRLVVLRPGGISPLFQNEDGRTRTGPLCDSSRYQWHRHSTFTRWPCFCGKNEALETNNYNNPHPHQLEPTTTLTAQHAHHAQHQQLATATRKPTIEGVSSPATATVPTHATTTRPFYFHLFSTVTASKRNCLSTLVQPTQPTQPTPHQHRHHQCLRPRTVLVGRHCSGQSSGSKIARLLQRLAPPSSFSIFVDPSFGNLRSI